MTIAMRIPAMAVPAEDVTWRALRTGLWVARRDGRHLGTVERGRRWTACDAEGEPIGAYRTLREAQAALAEPRVADPTARRATVRRSASLVPAIAVAAVALAAAASASVWAWTALLA